jgi:hypothetical protein
MKLRKLATLGAVLAILAGAAAVVDPSPATAGTGLIKSVWRNDWDLAADLNAEVEVASMSLPAGAYFISAKFTSWPDVPPGAGYATGGVICQLHARGTYLDFDETLATYDNAASFAVPVSLNVVHADPSMIRVVLRCRNTTQWWTHFHHLKITAISSDVLTNQPV